MKVADYLVDYLIRQGVTDAFGIPGGVILDLLYAMDARMEELTPHLCFHEQGAACAAVGYAQAKKKLGVAYATRGPGFTNMITTIADAYYDSVPLMIITAHSVSKQINEMRIEFDQELNPISMVADITKYAVRVDSEFELQKQLNRAYHEATSGRMGPVVLDILSSIFSKDITINLQIETEICTSEQTRDINTVVENILSSIQQSKRPVFLIGDGIKQVGMSEMLYTFISESEIPVISSRAAHDIACGLPNYYGFVGSHGTRFANFVLCKADLLIALGNRMSFPVNSESFGPIFNTIRTIRIDIDTSEFLREIPNTDCYSADLKELIPLLCQKKVQCAGLIDWIKVCSEIRANLWDCDQEPHIKYLMEYLEKDNNSSIVTCDVGNHEFWVSHAAVYAKIKKEFLYSKSFGMLGCSIPKAIGAYYATKKPVLCITGDQGMQMNIQELQYIAMHNIPICVFVINNHASGMIRSREIDKGKTYLLHTTQNSGYGVPNLGKLAELYGLKYYRCNKNKYVDNTFYSNLPALIEMEVDDTIGLNPSLPRGKECWDMIPSCEKSILEKIMQLS